MIPWPSSIRTRALGAAILAGALTLAGLGLTLRLEADASLAAGSRARTAGLRVAESALRSSCQALSLIERPFAAEKPTPSELSERQRWVALCAIHGLESRRPFLGDPKAARKIMSRQTALFFKRAALERSAIASVFPFTWASAAARARALADFDKAATESAVSGVRSDSGRLSALHALANWRLAALSASDPKSAQEAEALAETLHAQALSELGNESAKDLAALQAAPLHVFLSRTIEFYSWYDAPNIRLHIPTDLPPSALFLQPHELFWRLSHAPDLLDRATARHASAPRLLADALARVKDPVAHSSRTPYDR